LGNDWLSSTCFCCNTTATRTTSYPRIMNKVTGLHPAIILLSLSIWGSLLGITGLILALPMSTLLLSYYKKFASKPM